MKFGSHTPPVARASTSELDVQIRAMAAALRVDALRTQFFYGGADGYWPDYPKGAPVGWWGKVGGACDWLSSVGHVHLVLAVRPEAERTSADQITIGMRQLSELLAYTANVSVAIDNEFGKGATDSSRPGWGSSETAVMTERMADELDKLGIPWSPAAIGSYPGDSLRGFREHYAAMRKYAVCRRAPIIVYNSHDLTGKAFRDFHKAACAEIRRNGQRPFVGEFSAPGGDPCELRRCYEILADLGSAGPEIAFQYDLMDRVPSRKNRLVDENGRWLFRSIGILSARGWIGNPPRGVWAHETGS